MMRGRFDLRSPIGNAWELKRVWPRAELVTVDDAGTAPIRHSAQKPSAPPIDSQW
jgi:pimeloyl-ACP methyl ester carboxylesterase